MNTTLKERKAAKAHRLLKNNDPVIRPMCYDHDLLLALQYFNINYDNKDKKKWVVAHYPKVKFHPGHSDYYYKTLGTLVRLVDNGNDLSEEHLNKMDEELDFLTKPPKDMYSAAVQLEAPVVIKPSIQQAMDKQVGAFLSEFNAMLDEFCLDPKVIPKPEKLVTQMKLKGPMIKKVITKITPTMDEVKAALAGDDKYLVEGYSNFSKAELRKFVGIFDSLVTALGQAKVTVVRKTRVAKVKPPAVIAKNVKFCPENIDLGLKSINPALVVGTSEVWMFNPKYKKMYHYVAIDGMTLTFKGSALLNWDTNKSESKTVRKAETVKPLLGNGVRVWNKYYKELKGKVYSPNGRVNAETIILCTFK